MHSMQTAFSNTLKANKKHRYFKGSNKNFRDEVFFLFFGGKGDRRQAEAQEFVRTGLSVV